MLLTESNSTLTMIILAFAVMGLPQCGLLAINYLYQKNQQALTFPEKLGKKTPARDMMYLVFGCFTYLGMLFILPASTMSILPALYGAHLNRTRKRIGFSPARYRNSWRYRWR